MENIFCDGCIYLNITEEDQNKIKPKPPHFCNFHREVVFHKGCHPNIVKIAGCDGPYKCSTRILTILNKLTAFAVPLDLLVSGQKGSENGEKRRYRTSN